MSEPNVVDQVEDFIGRYVVMTDDERLAVALWVLHTYCYTIWRQTPYLAINSPERECGKTTLIEVLELLCNKSWSVINPSEAVVFRKIEKTKPTMLLDEVDSIFKKGSQYEHLAALLNTGNRATARVPRVLNPRSDELIEYSVFCPKVLAGIGTLPETVASRSIPIRLQRRTRDQIIERFRRRYVEPVAVALRDQIEAELRAKLEAEGIDDEPKLPDELSDRQQDCAEPLLSLADALGCGERARTALVSLFTGERADSDESYGVVLLHDLRAWFEARPAVDQAASAWLVGALENMDERPWSGYNYGRGVDAKALADLLKPYGVKPRGLWFEGDNGKKHQLRGYRREELEPVWERYATVTGDGLVTGEGVTAGTGDGVTVT